MIVESLDQQIAFVESVQIGLPQTRYDDASSSEWTTGFYKQQVTTLVEVTETKLVGDGQADRKHHGGHDKAVLAYAAKHYTYWSRILGSEVQGGAFGENLTVTNIDEANVCIGDVWQAGTAIFQVSQPRQPCWKLGRRWNEKTLPRQVVQTGFSGWYLRVLQTGFVQAGDEVKLAERQHADWTVERAHRLMFGDRNHPDRLRLAHIPALSNAWRLELLNSKDSSTRT